MIELFSDADSLNVIVTMVVTIILCAFFVAVHTER